VLGRNATGEKNARKNPILSRVGTQQPSEDQRRVIGSTYFRNASTPLP
jgi:hypothetical protein